MGVPLQARVGCGTGEGDTRRVSGHVSSQHGEYAEPVRVLAQALDPSGAVTGQRIVWVPGGIGGFGRGYFEIPDLPPASNYRITVWDYTYRQNGDAFR